MAHIQFNKRPPCWLLDPSRSARVYDGPQATFGAETIWPPRRTSTSLAKGHGVNKIAKSVGIGVGTVVRMVGEKV